MNPLSPEELRRLGELCEKATPGPWTPCGAPSCSCGLVWSNPADWTVARCDTSSKEEGVTVGAKYILGNQAFIAASREALPRLLDMVEAIALLIQTQHRLLSRSSPTHHTVFQECSASLCISTRQTLGLEQA